MNEIKKYVKNNNNFSKDNLIEELLEDSNIRTFAFENDLTTNTIEKSLNNLLSFKKENDRCIKCKSLDSCKQTINGFKPRLVVSNDLIVLNYTECKYKVNQLKNNSIKAKINTLFIPKKVLSASLEDYDTIGESRKEIYSYITRFISIYSKDEFMKGLYIHGVYGTGKTFILSCIANELARRGLSVTFTYYPDLVRELKSSISTGSLEEKIELLKEVDILMLDDIGGESVSAWVRDEILGPILQHRTLEELPTFFSSNLNMKNLSEQMVVNNSLTEKIKSARIHARIFSLAKEFNLQEKHRVVDKT